MARALHPELVKRILVTDTATGRSFLQTMGASALVNGTRHGYGKSTPADRRQKDVTVLDVFGNAAVAKAVMADWIDYLQLARVDGRWLIVNVLWERKPGRKGIADARRVTLSEAKGACRRAVACPLRFRFGRRDGRRQLERLPASATPRA